MRKARILAPLIGAVAALGAAIALSTPADAASGVNYVAMGDSYSSGVGAGSYISDSGDCLRSTNAYSALWASANSPASYTSVACSGATTDSMISSQLSALSSSTTLVSFTVGGNDVGFTNIMETCILGGTDDCVAAVQQAEDYAQTELPGKLDTLYSDISSDAPNAKVVVLDYPVFYQLDTLCVGLSAESHEKLDEGINLLNGVLQDAASRHGFTFADVTSIFVGHQLCSGDDWLHSLNITDITESYHPTATGQSDGYLPVFSQYAS
jgi:lysophospholipase L1-like esterase